MKLLASLRRLLRRWSAADEAQLTELKGALSARLDQALGRLRAGTEPDDAELAALGKMFNLLYLTLCRRNGTDDNGRFDEDDRLDFYVRALELSALAHPEHDAWPSLAPLRRQVLDGLLARLQQHEDPWLRLCAVTAALASGLPERALESHARLAHDPFLTELANRWANRALICFPAYNPRPAYEKFLAATAREDAWNLPDGSAPRNRWVLLASIYPDLSADPRTTLADARVAASQRGSLARDWEVVDRPSARATLEWLRAEGHRAALATDLDAPDFTDRPAHAAFVAQNRAALDRHRILAWDCGRYVAVARSACAAGYLGEDEVEKLLEWVETSLRETYDSWAEYGADYILGVGYFSPEEAGSHAHTAIVRWLLDDPRSPWRRVPFGGPSSRN